MNDEHLPTKSKIIQHIQTLVRRLEGVPELEPVFTIIRREPGTASGLYQSYITLIIRISKLNKTEITAVKDAKQELRKNQGEVGSASKIGAADILFALNGRSGLLAELAIQSVEAKSPYYQPALDLLAERMLGGHQYKLSGKTPSDKDSATHNIIWGHTIITNPETLLHFVVCHYLERYFAEALMAHGLEFALEKDFFINGMIDTVILDGLKSAEDPIFQLWLKPKAEGGLGWITADRFASFAA